MTLDKNSDAVNLLRKIGNQKHKKVVYRDRRPHMFAEHFVYEANNEGECYFAIVLFIFHYFLDSGFFIFIFELP